jgi:osmotically-inducible protein OsmY
MTSGLVFLPACSTAPVDPGSADASTTDSDIEDDVQDRLRQDDMTGRYPLSVTSEEGVVTLTGFVPTEAARMRAVSVTRGASGVKGVIDNLTR